MPNIMCLGVGYVLKIVPRQSWRVCLIQRQNSCDFGVHFEWRKVDKKPNLHENWNMQTVFYSISNISAKCYQNRLL